MRNWTQADFLTPDLVELSARAAGWFEALRNQICSQLEAVERDAEDSPLSNQPTGCFKRKNWTRDGGGGGQISVMHGRVLKR